jgi:hypothetical protein
LTSPDSPQDRRAVAAAFRKAEAELVAQQNRYIGEGSQKVVESGQLKPRRRPMLTSRSLDEKVAFFFINSRSGEATQITFIHIIIIYRP